MDKQRFSLIKLVAKTCLFLIGAMTLVSAYNFADVGNSQEVHLQSPNGVITASNLQDAQSGTLEYVSADADTDWVDYSGIIVFSDIHPRQKNDTRSIADNTFVVTQVTNEEGVVDELIDPSEFNYDGNPFWVNVPIANVRSMPSTTADIVTELNYGDRIIRISYGSNWSSIRTDDGQNGFILTELLDSEEIVIATPTPTFTPTPTVAVVNTVTNTPTTTQVNNSSYSVTPMQLTLYASCSLNVRSGPGTDYSMVTSLRPGEVINVTGQTDNGWYQMSNGYFVKSSLCSSTAPTPIPEAPSTGTTSTGNDFASYCMQFLGTVYIYGGRSPSGFDCSGFVSYCYANYYGISLPHNAAEISYLGTAVSTDSVQCGDVLCHDYNHDGYVDHVSMYIGNGTCIHASNSRQGVITSAYPMGSIVTIRRFL